MQSSRGDASRARRQLSTTLGVGSPGVDRQGTEDTFADYVLQSSLVESAGASVYRARPRSARVGERQVALKVLNSTVNASRHVVDSFRQEAYLMALLRHPNLVQTFETGVHAGRFFIATEFVEGADLQLFLERMWDRGEVLPTEFCFFVIGEILRGLVAAHALQDADGTPLSLIHRDIKPSNVLVSFAGGVKLADFGVAAISGESGDFVGTPGYLAPEYFAGEEPDQRTDLYAVGVVLWELLAGRKLFEGSSTGELMRANERGKVLPLVDLRPNLASDVEIFLQRSLASRVEDRFASAAQMLTAADRLFARDAGTYLGAAALVRDVLLSEYKELVLGPSLSLRGAGKGKLVGLCVSDPELLQQLREMLLSNGYWVEVFNDPRDVGEMVQAHPFASPFVVQLDPDSFPVAPLVQQLAKAVHLIPVVAVSRSSGWSTLPFGRAFSIGAVDILSSPIRLPRFIAAVETAARDFEMRSIGESADAGGADPAAALLVSPDADLISDVCSALEPRGFVFLAAPNHEEALQKLRERSVRVAVFDGRRDLAACHQFVDGLRANPGLGVIPVLLLVDDVSLAPSWPQPHVVVRSRSDPPVVLGAALREVLAKRGTQRAFTRVTVTVLGRISHLGRWTPARATEISRGGVRLACEVAPALHARVGLCLNLPSERGETIEARGVVMRVEPPAEHTSDSYFAVELTHFEAGHEAAWIAFITELLPGSAALPASPPPPDHALE